MVREPRETPALGDRCPHRGIRQTGRQVRGQGQDLPFGGAPPVEQHHERRSRIRGAVGHDDGRGKRGRAARGGGVRGAHWCSGHCRVWRGRQAATTPKPPVQVIFSLAARVIWRKPMASRSRARDRPPASVTLRPPEVRTPASRLLAAIVSSPVPVWPSRQGPCVSRIPRVSGGSPWT